MADKIVVSGARGYDGEYELDLADEPLTILERRWIKKISGYVGAAVLEGWVNDDADMDLSLTVIAMRRNGKIEKSEVLRVAEVLEDGAKITWVFEPVAAEVEDDPPVEAPTEPRSSEGSGERSNLISDPPGPIPSATGDPGSERSADSDRVTLVI